jgi:tripartite-type tricarboxylate transporter receptor subunit TctC
MVPAKAPRPVIDRLNAAFHGSLTDRKVRQAISASVVELVGGSPEVSGAYLQTQSAELKTVAQAANLVRQ